MPRQILYITIFVLLFVEVMGAAYYLTRPLPVPTPTDSEIQGATLSFVPPQGAINLNESVFVKINLDTGHQETDGARTIINFDPEMIFVEAVNTDIAAYELYPIKSIDNINGQVVISGVIEPNGVPFNGTDTFATLKIKGLQAGSAALGFEFKPNETTDSNVALHGVGQDILLRANGAVFTVTGN